LKIRFLGFRYEESAKICKICIEKHSQMVYNRYCSKCVYRCLKRMHRHHIHFEFGQRGDMGSSPTHTGGILQGSLPAKRLSQRQDHLYS